MNIYVFTETDERIPHYPQYNFLYFRSDRGVNSLFASKKPDIILSVGEEWTPFEELDKLPLYIRQRWTHVQDIATITPDFIESLFVALLDKRLSPTISVFTSAYKSGPRILRPFTSLLLQTYSNWEWIVLDDSPADDLPSQTNTNPQHSLEKANIPDHSLEKDATNNGLEKANTVEEKKDTLDCALKKEDTSDYNREKDTSDHTVGEKKDSEGEKDGDTWARLKCLAMQDCRIRIFKSAGNDGHIGSVKHTTASMARGLYILELDHDDELLPTALEKVVAAFEDNPEVGMVASDCAEIYEETLDNFSYGGHFGYGRHGYYKERYQGRWVNVARNGPLDRYTIRHIIGVPNHLRAWRYSTYTQLRGHDFNLNVADDYELIVRTFLLTTIAIIPELLYIQYRNRGGNNFTVIRNDLIQKLVKYIGTIYEERIQHRLVELGLPDFNAGEVLSTPPNIYLSYVPELSAYTLLPSHHKIAIILPTYNGGELLTRAVRSILEQEFTEWVLYIIGDNCPTLERTMKFPEMHDPRIKYWNVEVRRGEGHCHSRNYALKILATTDYIAYLDESNYWFPGHLTTLYRAITKRDTTSNTMFAFSSFRNEAWTVVCAEPKLYRVTTSCLLHKRELLTKYGYWNVPSVVGPAPDWELVARWVRGGVNWVTTGLPSVYYSNPNIQLIYQAYDDQRE